jgi:hypothetical protein
LNLKARFRHVCTGSKTTSVGAACNVEKEERVISTVCSYGKERTRTHKGVLALKLDLLRQEGSNSRSDPQQDLLSVLSFSDEERVTRHSHRDLAPHIRALDLIDAEDIRLLVGEKLDPLLVLGITRPEVFDVPGSD